MEKYDIDETKFDTIVFGTDLSESIISSSLANRNFKVLNLEFDNIYSGTLKSLNFKEIRNFLENSSETFKDQLYLKKGFQFYKEEVDSLEKVQERLGFRGFNIDLETKFLFSEALSTQELINIGLDQYLTFTTVKKIYQNFQDQIFELPVNKKMIFKNKALSLMQKKNFLDTIYKIQSFIQYKYSDVQDVNSTKELQKQIYDQSQFKEFFDLLEKNLKKKHSVLFDEILKSDNKLLEHTLRYSIVARPLVKEKDDMNLEEFFSKFKDFILSIGTHSDYPFLYTIYGIGDLSQVFSRIGAIHGSIFMLNKEFNLKKIEMDENETFHISLGHRQYSYEFEAKNLIVGNEFVSLFKNLLKDNLELKYDFFQRINIIAEITENDDIRSKLPLIINIPEKNENFENQQPIRIIVMGENTKTTPLKQINIQIQTLLQNEQDQINISNYIENCDKILKDLDLIYDKILSFNYIFKSLQTIKIIKKTKNVFYLTNSSRDLSIEDSYLQSRKIGKQMELVKTQEDFLINKKKQQKEKQQKNIKKFEDELDELAAFNLQQLILIILICINRHRITPISLILSLTFKRLKF